MASAKIVLRIEGLEELKRKLDQMPDALANRALKKGVKAAAQLIKAEVATRVPVGDTGNLKRSLLVKANEGRRDEALALVGHSQMGFHAHLVEFGTQPHYITAGTFRGKPTNKRVLSTDQGQILGREVLHLGARPRPYMFPAYESKKTEAIAAIVSAVNDVLMSFALRA